MSEPVVVAAAQYASEAGQVTANLDTAQDLVRRAGELGAALVVLPEYCISGYDRDWYLEGAPGGGTEVDGPVVRAMAALAAELDLTVVFNDLERAGDRLYSSSFVVAGGSLVGRHRKTIVTAGEDAAGVSRGDRASTPLRTPHVPVAVGPMVCFEHGFPEIAMHLALAGAGLLAISSAISSGTEYLRNLRTRARAQDNGCYAVAANAIGDGYCGESMIVDPRGDVLVRASADRPEVIVATLDPALIEEERRKEPVLALRRPELHAAP